MRISGFIFSVIWLLALANPVWGQSKFLPSAFRVGTDVTDLLHSAFDEKVTKYQILANFDVHKFFVVGEYGNYETITYQDFRYDNKGQFFRVGIDYNVLHKSVENNALFVGLRYAQSNFDDQTLFFEENPVWGTQPILAGNEGVKASWYEITSGLRVRIWNQLYMGYTFRIKLILKQEGIDEIDAFSVPGFGRADDNTSVGLNYQIFYRIPFRDKKKS